MTIRMLSLFCFTLFVAGCGAGSSTSPPPVPTTSVTGVTFDAPIQDGVVRIYSFASGRPGVVLGVGSTDPQGKFNISIQSENQPILIAVTGGRYIEEASSKLIQLQDGQVLYAVKNFVMSQPVSVAVSYYTTLAAGYAEYLVGKGASVGVAIDQANTMFSGIAGFDVVTTQPLDIAAVTNATPWLTAGHEYGFSAAAISGLTLSACRTNRVADHVLYNSIGFIQRAYDDIRTDGMLDGKGAQGALSMGVVPQIARVYRHELAIHILEMARNVVNRTSLTPTHLVDTAKRLNDSTAGVFGSDPTVPLSEGGPTVSNFSINNGAPVSGVINLTVQIVSVVPLATVNLVVDSGTPIPGNPMAPSFMTDTRTLPDGIHTLAVQAIDVAGVSSIASIQVLVDNTPPQAFNRTLGSPRGGFYGIYTEAGSGIANIWVVWGDGVISTATVTPASATGGTWSVPLRYSSWSLHATDRVGNSCMPVSGDPTNCQ